ncbi:limbin isoform X2 [Sorex araneus]|uniref:limbin isoform X2 n=1 Tax=Sorex araneus TaxID=42254 RepID=UPI002433F21B|nr:limbin isoform X2 [Sorex araneus]
MGRWVLAGALLLAALARPAQDTTRPPRARVGAALRVAVEAPLGRKHCGEGRVSEPLPAPACDPRAPLLAVTPSWPKKTLFKRESPRTHTLFGGMSRAVQDVSESGVVFQKCAEGPEQGAEGTLTVRLVVANPRLPGAADLSDLLLLDNVTGLRVHDPPGNHTPEGLQAFRRDLLQVGDAFSVSYTASLDAGGSLTDGDSLQLAALLLFPSSSPNRTQLRAPFTVVVEEQLRVLPHHGLHAAGFFLALVISFVLTWLALFFVAQYRGSGVSLLPTCQAQHPEGRPEHSQFSPADGVGDDLALSEQMVDILASGEPEGMLQALEELEIATLNRADSELEACRTRVSKDIIFLLLRSLGSHGHVSPQVERRMGAAFKAQFLLLEKEIQEEYDRKMVALAAESDLESRKKTENQYQREMAAMEEAEEVLKHVSERSAAECSSLLRSLHGLEQEQLRQALALRQEEDFARARRQLAVFQRSELHSIFFAQIRGAVSKGELQPELAEALLQDYTQIQEDVEELMDFLQARKRWHLSKRFAHREYLVRSMQATESRVQGLLRVAAAQLSLLIQKHERAGYLDEEQTEALLERVHTEVFSVTQKLDSDLKQEKKKLRQKLLVRSRRETLQKHREQRKEQLALSEAFRAAEDVGQYLEQWRSLLADHGAALEELQERLDQAALDELRALTLARAERATEELRRMQSSGMTQELLKRNAPWLFLQQILEEHGQEMATRAARLEAEERDRGQEGVQGVRQRLKDDALEAAVQEQAELRHWEQLIFTQLCASCLSLSQEELLGLRREAQGCFAQMDRSLALPRIRARALQRRLLAAWRDAEALKLDQALAAPELQHPAKGKKTRSRNKSKADLLKRRLEDKVRLSEEQPPEDLLEKVRAELRAERLQQLEAQEGCFAESLVSLQFQKVAWTAGTLWACSALLSIQGLLLEELSASGALTSEACTRVLDSHCPELQELEKRLEDKLALQEAAGLQRALASQQQWAAEGPRLLQGPEGPDSERQLSAALQRALSQRPTLLKQQQQSLREEQQDWVVLEDLLEKMEMDAVASLYGQELRLTSYLSKLSSVPAGTLQRLLTLALPTALQPELLAALDSWGQKHPDHALEGASGEQADSGRQRKHGNWWQGLESRLEGELISRGAERMRWAQQRKESILGRPCAPLRDRAVFSGTGSWPHLTLEPLGQVAPVSILGEEAVESLSTGEKLFIFRNPQEPELSLHGPPRRKKKNFLNAKSAARARGLD